MHIENEAQQLVRDFLLILKRSWPTTNHQFGESDELAYRENLILFCNISKSINISPADLQTINNFVYNSIVNLTDNVINTGVSSPYVKECVSYILTFLDYLVVNYNLKHITQELLRNSLKYMLTIAASVDDANINEVLMEFYDSTDLLRHISHYMSSLNMSGIEEITISNFMKKARYTAQSRLFRFYLYCLNDQYFRTNYPAFADECSPRELYYGILYNYFKLTYNGEVYKVFLNMCNNVSDDIIYLKNHNNPVYNYFLLSQDNCHLSLKDIYPQIGRLFHN